jgi:hypothetical protein
MSLSLTLPPAEVLIAAPEPDPVLNFARTELQNFWSSSCGEEELKSCSIRFVLQTDPAMEPGSFSERQTVDRSATWLGSPAPVAMPALPSHPSL